MSNERVYRDRFISRSNWAVLEPGPIVATNHGVDRLELVGPRDFLSELYGPVFAKEGLVG